MNALRQIATAILEDCRYQEGSAFGPGGLAEIATAHLVNVHGIRTPAGDALNSYHRALILGPPGAGKSTLLRVHATALAQRFLIPIEETNPTTCAPLLISAATLHKYYLETHSIVQSLAEYCDTRFNVPARASEVERWLETGAVELLIDGLDEMALDWNVTVAELSDLFRRMPKLRGVLTSRPAALTVTFTNFAVYTIPDLDLDQTQEIVLRQTAGRPELGEHFLTILGHSRQIAALARTPLLLRMMLRLLDELGELPANRTGLISTATELLIRRWERTRVDGTLSLRDTYGYLAAIAATMFEAGQPTMSRTALAQVMRDEIGPSGLDIASIALEEIERGILSTGVLREVEGGEFRFSHKAFLQYFTAWRYRNDLPKLLRFFWHEDGESVLEFAGGMVENAALLVEEAVERGRLVLAARIASSRNDNSALIDYVALAFRNALDPNSLSC